MLSFSSFNCIIIMSFIGTLLSFNLLHNFSILFYNLILLFIQGKNNFFLFFLVHYFISLIYGFQFIIIDINIFILLFITNSIYLISVIYDLISVILILWLFFKLQTLFCLYVHLIYLFHLHIIIDIFIVIYF